MKLLVNLAPTLWIFSLLAPHVALAASPDSTLEKVKTIILPLVEFEDAPFEEALARLEAASVANDELSVKSERGVKIKLARPDENTSTVHVTLRLSNVPLVEAIRYIAAVADCTFQIRENTVHVVRRTTPDGGAEDLWFAAFMHLQSAETFENDGQFLEARRRMVEARDFYERLHTKHPECRPRMVGELLRQIDKRLASGE